MEQLNTSVAVCRKLSPTHWILEVNVTKEPAVVVLPIPHDPLWQASGKGAIAIYGVNVGFYVKTGRYAIIYTPEKIFQTSLVIALAVLSFIVYLMRKTNVSAQ